MPTASTTGRTATITTYVLIYGAGGGASDWHLLAAELRGQGHDVVELDLARFYHDVPPELAAEAVIKWRDQTEAPMMEAWPLDA